MISLFRFLSKLSIKYRSYLKSTKIDAFKQKICNVTKTDVIMEEYVSIIAVG